MSVLEKQYSHSFQIS